MNHSSISRHYLPLVLGMVLLLIGTACDQTPYTPPSSEEPEPDPGPEDVVKQEVPKNKSTQGDEVYWTEARMEAAQPATAPQPESKAGNTSSVPLGPARPNPDREPVRQSGRLPEHTNGDVEDVQGLDSSSKSHGLESSQVSSPAQYPYSAVGKVFFVNNDGEDIVCSGAVINTKNNSTVWTAGHCLSEQGEQDWYDNWVFVPGYNDGNAPFGRWSALEKGTLRGWHVNGNGNYDLGAVEVERKDGEPIADVTGSFGHVSNISRDQDWEILGYPVGGDRFGADGQMWQCSASFTEIDDYEEEGGPEQSIVDDCDMTGGASGGPWITDFEDCPECWVNSAFSRGTPDLNHLPRSKEVSGPYHGEGAVNLYEAFGGWKP